MISEVKARPDAGRRVLLARLEAGISQRVLAERSGLDQSTIVRVERSGGNIRPMTLGRLASALNIPIEELLEDRP
jgi:transcriptional regulator with XRE-family HTH domain